MLNEKIEQDLIEALKAKQETEVSTLRMLKSALLNKKIEKLIAKEEFLGDDEVIAVIKTEVKKRNDSVIAYEEVGRQDLADKEKLELSILNKYLPAQMDEDAVRDIIKETIKEIAAQGPSDFGKVMGAAMTKTKNQADGQMVSKIVKEQLNNI